MTIHALAPQCAERQEQYFELFRMQYSQNFLPPPLDSNGGRLTAPTDSLAAQWFFSLLCSSKNRHPPPKKKLDTALTSFT